jgi:cobalt/nickel transport protein
MKKPSGNWLLVLGSVALAMGPLLVLQGKDFGATDDHNSTAIEELRPGYKPWFNSMIKPSGGEVETFLFATQAALGAGVTGYVIGLYKGRSEGRSEARQRDDRAD